MTFRSAVAGMRQNPALLESRHMLSLSRNVWRRARQERLPQAAGGLTFATVLSLVPLLAVSFALFARFPVLRPFKNAIEEHLLQSLLPADISRAVLKYLVQFAGNANGLTWVGSVFLLLAAMALLLAVENALNQIWEVKEQRPLFKRLGLYLLMLGLGAPVLGASLWATSYLASISKGLIGTVSPWVSLVLNSGPVVLGVLGLAAMFYLVPNTGVRRRDALVGGVLGSVAFELGKRGFAIYILNVPTYKAVYGAFALLPVFLLWVYFSWLVTLAAALITANLGPSAPRRRGLRKLKR
jgi:membrane protein